MCERECVSVCYARERECVGVREIVCVCVCVCAREREREIVCVCVRCCSSLSSLFVLQVTQSTSLIF